MELETTQTSTIAKLPILKYENGKSFKPLAQTTTNDASTSTTHISSLVTTEEKAQKKNDVKARSMLLMALPNEHLMTFNQYKDAKSLFPVIKTRFCGNEATKKTQKTLLKQMCKNFSATSTENKSDLDTMRIDDLYNNFKIVKQEVKGTTSSISSSQNMDFVSSPSTNSTNEVPTAYGVSTASTQPTNQSNRSQLVHEDLEQIHEDDLEEMDLEWQLALLSMREKIGHKNQDSRNMYQESSRRIVNVEETLPKAMVSIDGVGFDWSFMADVEVPINMALMAFSDTDVYTNNTWSQIPNNSKKGLGYESYHVVPPPPTWLFLPPKLDLSNSGLEEFKQLEYESYGPKYCKIKSKNASSDIPSKLKESLNAPLVKDRVSDNKDSLVESPVVVEKKTDVPTIAKVEFVRPKQQEKPVRKRVKYAEMYRERVVSRNNYTRVNNNISTRKTHPNAHRNMALRAVLMKISLRPLNTVRPRPVNTAWPRSVNTVRPNTAVVNVVRVNQVNAVKASACHPQMVQEDQGYVDSGCSRHMTGNMSYLSDFKKFDGGYFTFGRSKRWQNYEVQIQALVDKKKVTIIETSVRSDHHLEDAEVLRLLLGTNLAALWPLLSSVLPVVQVFLDSQVEGMLKHKEIYVTPSHTKNIFLNMKRQGKDFSDEHVTTTSNDPLSGENRLKLTKLMDLCTKLQSRVLALETTKANQALDIRSLKRKVKKLEKKKELHWLMRLGGRNDQEMFDTSIFNNEEVVVKEFVTTKEVSIVDPVTTAGEVVTTAGVEDSVAAITSQISMDEITLAKALIDIKTSKPKAKGIVIQEPSETTSPTPIDSFQQSSKAKDKDKAKIIEPKKPLKRKYHIMIDEDVARNLKARMQSELEKEERLAR
nr:hypothetical protein [Tanacetum cinerariifolium]